jgi:hypothetical protein
MGFGLREGFGFLTFHLNLNRVNDALKSYPFRTSHHNRQAQINRAIGVKVEGNDV